MPAILTTKQNYLTEARLKLLDSERFVNEVDSVERGL